MKVTRKIPSISMHVRLDDSESTASAESAHAGAMARPRPSSGGGGGRTRGPGGWKRAKSSSGGPPLGEGAEGGTIDQLSDLKLETDPPASSKKSCDSKGRGKSQQVGGASVNSEQTIQTTSTSVVGKT